MLEKTLPLTPASKIAIVDNVLSDEQRDQIFQFLSRGDWRFGWKAVPQAQFAFWHRHFAGQTVSDHNFKEGPERPYDCAEELREAAPLIHGLWSALEKTALDGHTLVRCYANGLPYGCDGTLHTDSSATQSYTSIYYPHEKWYPTWGGDTVFFNHDSSDIIAAVYPKPNRLVTFPGSVPHVARGVARMCPELRITLMFKTERRHG